MRAAVKEQNDKLLQMQQQVGQFATMTQQQQQAAWQRQQIEAVQSFDKELDGLDNELFGKAATQTGVQNEKRGALFTTLRQMAQAGLVREINRDSVERAFALAFPKESQEQLRRQLLAQAAADAKAGAQNRLAVGKPAPNPRTKPVDDPAKDPQVKEWYEKAQRGELTRDSA